MKKILSVFAGVVFSVSVFAQLAPGSTAPNWTFQDLNGNTWDLYTLTAQGKTVFIDVSATWCGPCWGYHNTHALRDVYDEYGPTGTIAPGEIMVFFIEGDQATTIADLNGTGSNTQGDWVTGTTYPIIDPGSATNTFNSNYAIGYFPTVYKVCPDNKIYEVGQLSAQGLLNSINGCTFATDGQAASVTGVPSLTCTSSFTPTFTLTNNGTSTLTTCDIIYDIDGSGAATINWTGSLATSASATVTLPTMTATNGSHTFNVRVANPNGGSDNNNTNNLLSTPFTVVAGAGTASPLTQNFGSATFPYAGWATSNPDGLITWEQSSAAGSGGAMKFDCYSYSTVGAQDDFVVEAVDLSTATSASLQFDVAHRRYSTQYTDALSVLVSTDCGVTWTQVWNKSGATLQTVATVSTAAFVPTSTQWRAECVDLTAYAGQNKVFVMFRGINGYGNNIWVDNINVSNIVCPVGINDAAAASTNMQLFPNPANQSVMVNFSLTENTDVVVNIYNTLGELVSTENKGNMSVGQQTIAISTEAFANGLYTVELVAGENKSVSRLSVSH